MSIALTSTQRGNLLKSLVDIEEGIMTLNISKDSIDKKFYEDTIERMKKERKHIIKMLVENKLCD